MKANIHPTYDVITVTCSCGNKFETRSTIAENSKEVHLDVCSSCHPFYTGNQKVIDTAGRVDMFKKKFSMFGSSKKTGAEDKK
jgi:large subunit ribosomal protein L31